MEYATLHRRDSHILQCATTLQSSFVAEMDNGK